jgi:hypothetical protein
MKIEWFTYQPLLHDHGTRTGEEYRLDNFILVILVTMVLVYSLVTSY